MTVPASRVSVGTSVRDPAEAQAWGEAVYTSSFFLLVVVAGEAIVTAVVVVAFQQTFKISARHGKVPGLY